MIKPDRSLSIGKDPIFEVIQSSMSPKLHILILDEATSQIDLESEQLIHQALEEFARDRTVLMITHRLASLDLADRILVMEAGRVADFGTHEQLLSRCGLYQRLYSIHFQKSA